MNVYLLRHGTAAPREDYDDDDIRPLTEDGKRKTRQAALGMATLGIAFDQIITSPLLRAHQTAEITASALGHRGEFRKVDLLGHQFSPDGVTKMLAKIRPGQSVLLVGHEPDLSTLASFLCCGEPSLRIDFKKGALCLIRFPSVVSPGAGDLVFLLHNRHLRGCGK